jgi:hypothetical protein
MEPKDYFREHKRLIKTLFKGAAALKTKTKRDDTKAKKSLIKEARNQIKEIKGVVK